MPQELPSSCAHTMMLFRLPLLILLSLTLLGCGDDPVPNRTGATFPSSAEPTAPPDVGRASDGPPSVPVVSRSDATPDGSLSGPRAATSDEHVGAGPSKEDVSPLPSAADLEGVPPTPLELKEQLAAERRKLDETVWANEVLAQQYEQALVRLWDALLDEERKGDSGDPFQVFQRLDFDRITLSQPQEEQPLDLGITVTHFGGPARTLTRDEWQQFVNQIRADGYRIIQSEWHHAQFDPVVDGSARSAVTMAVYLERPQHTQRLVLQGTLRIGWRVERDAKGIPVPEHIDASDLELLTRTGPIAFDEVLTIDHATPETRSGLQPVIAHDVNGDGLSELILGGSNELIWNRGGGKFERDRLCSHPEPIFEVGLVADLTGDGRADYLVPGLRGDLLLYVADASGRFTNPPIGKAREGGPLRQPQVIAAGDIDNDGDLDLWIGQYRISYLDGQMPTPYYDANDGFPAYLLLNDGAGHFTPATEEAGLAEKRHRRSYGGVLVDLDGDTDLDLLVVSDFAGIDLYHNDGTGYFTDVTSQLVDERHLFGMSATFGDYDQDGQLDFFVTGMASTTARRLEYMKLGRREQPDIHLMRHRMGYGNRMYLARDGRWVEPPFRDQVARTGWTWGATTLDFDNDGDRDIFVANGHSSGKSTKDHCTHFWCHDIYLNSSQPNPAVNELFRDVLRGYFDRTESWDGYQKSVLLMNQAGKGFKSIAFLMGVGQQYDGRAVLSDDIDADGRMDLVVVEDRWSDGQILHVYRNQLDTPNHWIGVRLREEGLGRSPLGAQVIAHTAQGIQIACVVAGDSIHAQHAPVVHFGLGQTDQVESIEIVWPGGTRQQLQQPVVDRYHNVPGSSSE